MVNGLLVFFHNITSPLQWSLNWVNVLEVCFIALIVFIFYRKFIRNTQSETLVKGLVFLIFAWIFSEILILLKLEIIGVFFKTLVTLIALSLIVIFQPELRRFLGYLGQPGFIKRTFFTSGSYCESMENDTDIIKEIIEAVKYLTKTKTGALIVFKKAMSSMAYSEVGTNIDAKVSTESFLAIMKLLRIPPSPINWTGSLNSLIYFTREMFMELNPSFAHLTANWFTNNNANVNYGTIKTKSSQLNRFPERYDFIPLIDNLILQAKHIEE